MAKESEKKKQNKRPRKQEKPEFEQRLVDLARVTRVMAGGKRMSFRACLVLGDMKGKVGLGVAKGADVSAAISKAAIQAKKHMITVPIVNDTIAHEVHKKFKAAKILIKPAVQGTGVKAGGAVRTVLELAGVKNIVSKQLGASNKLNNVKATILALESIKMANTAAKKSKNATKKVNKDAN